MFLQRPVKEKVQDAININKEYVESLSSLRRESLNGPIGALIGMSGLVYTLYRAKGFSFKNNMVSDILFGSSLHNRSDLSTMPYDSTTGNAFILTSLAVGYFSIKFGHSLKDVNFDNPTFSISARAVEVAGLSLAIANLMPLLSENNTSNRSKFAVVAHGGLILGYFVGLPVSMITYGIGESKKNKMTANAHILTGAVTATAGVMSALSGFKKTNGYGAIYEIGTVALFGGWASALGLDNYRNNGKQL